MTHLEQVSTGVTPGGELLPAHTLRGLQEGLQGTPCTSRSPANLATTPSLPPQVLEVHLPAPPLPLPEGGGGGRADTRARAPGPCPRQDIHTQVSTKALGGGEDKTAYRTH